MQLFNSLSAKKEKFTPLSENNVSIYVCGITPYDTTHIGHAFLYIFFDVLVRYLKFKGYKVSYTQNVTDIDDDLLKRAKETGWNWKKLGDHWTKKFLEDLKTLNIAMPDTYVKATDAVPTIIEIIKNLLDKKLAYLKEGNVFFDISKFKGYGALSKYKREEMIKIAKERGGSPDDPLRDDPLDFTLWQSSKKGEPYWDSPWGRGRPGWHIECSAMIYETLGGQIDIHGGGYDLIFPHHESERAQSESFTGKSPFVRHWMHAAMLYFQGEKMSKSLGNLVMVSDLLKKYSADAIRFLLLSHHYREVWEFDYKELEEAEEIVNGLTSSRVNGLGSRINEFTDLMDDDLNIPDALNWAIRNKSSKALEILGL